MKDDGFIIPGQILTKDEQKLSALYKELSVLQEQKRIRDEICAVRKEITELKKQNNPFLRFFNDLFGYR